MQTETRIPSESTIIYTFHCNPIDLANTEVFGSDTSDERVQNENCVSRYDS